MTAPTTSAYASKVPKSGITNIDALLSGEKWGYALSTNSSPLTISYSFPWINGLSAVFSAPAGEAYSTDREEKATFHFGLNNTQQAAATLALTAWSNVANINFQLVSETSTNVGDIRFAFTSATNLSNAWGWASYPNWYWPKGGDVWINSEYGSDTDWGVGTHHFESLMHEIGHALGLKHPFEDGVVLSSNLDNSINTIMAYTDINDVYPNAGYVNGKYDWLTYRIQRETPMVLDIAAIQYIYGANNNYKTGDDTYIFDPTKPFFKTIWDAGGKDTISVSNFSLACVIDLTPGSYSSLRYPRPSDTGGVTVTYDGTNNLGIAFNCIIENVIGGSGSDKLTGNSANNSLDGGSGNDVMYGGAGNDTFDWESSKRSGNDTMYGGMGDDVFVLDSVNDIVIEYANEGKDTIWVSFSYSIVSLPNIEILYGIGSSALNLTGNSADNYLAGGTGDDVIDGGDGLDFVIYKADIFDDCIITTNGSSFTIKSKTQGTDTLKNVEKLVFADKNYDLSSLKPTPTYKLTAATTIVNEGSTATFLLSTSNVAAGSSITYTLSGISAADIVGGALSGNAVISSNGQATISVPIVADRTTEGNETLTVTVQGQTASTTLVDTSVYKGPTDKDLVYVFKSEKTGAGVNPASYSYFYTVDAAEANYIKGQASWPWVQKTATFEAAHSNPSSSVPVFRFWSDKHQSHFFTINSGEKDQIINWSKTGTNGYDWKFEGEGFRVYPDGSTTDGAGKSAISVYRLWMDDKDFNAANGLSGGHFFTADKGEYDSMIKLVGVKGEGIAFYGEPPGG